MSDIEPLVLDPGGWPNVVAAGELVESAWGNAVVGALSQGIHHELFYSSAESGDITTTPVAATTVSLATYTGHLYSIRGYLSAIARTGTVSYAIVRLTVNGAVANTLPVTLFASNVPANADLSITWKATTTATATFVHDVAQASYSPNAVRFVIDNAHPRGLTIFDHGIAPMIFGDIEPEDGWDPDDDPHVLVDNLERRLVLLHAEREPNEYESLTQRLLGIGGRIEFARQRPGLTARDLLRIDHLDDDVAWTWGRL